MSKSNLAEGYSRDQLSNMTLELFLSLPYEEQKKLYNWYSTDYNWNWVGNSTMNPKNLRKAMSTVPLKEKTYVTEHLPEITITPNGYNVGQKQKAVLHSPEWTQEDYDYAKISPKTAGINKLHISPAFDAALENYKTGLFPALAIGAPLLWTTGMGVIAPMFTEAGVGAAATSGAKYLSSGAKSIGNTAMRAGYKYIPKVAKVLDTTFPGTQSWWNLYNSGKVGKVLAGSFAAGEAFGTATAVNNFMENPSAENATYAGLSMIPWAAGTTNGIRSYNTARNYSKVTKALETKHDIDLDASYAGDVLRKHGIGPKDYIHINGREGYDPMTGEYRMMTGSYEKDGQLVPLGGYEVDRQGNKQTAIWFKQGSSEYNPRSGDVYVLPYANSADIPLHQEDWGNVFVSRNPIDMQKIRKFRWDYDKHDLVEIPTEYTSKLTEAEKLGIPRGERNLWLKGRTADMAQDVGIGLKNPKYQQRVRDLHFLAKAPETKIKDAVWHSSEEPFTEFDLSKFGTTDNGFFGYGFYFTPYEKYAASYHPINRRFFVNVKNPYIGQNSEYFNRPQYVYDILLKRKSKVLEEFKSGKLSSFAEKQGISLNMSYDLASHLMDNYIAKQIPKWNNKYLRFLEEFAGKDGVFEMRRLQGNITKPANITEIVIPKSELVKLADAVTYDNSGKVIPISKRDNFTNPDIRFKSGGKLNYLNYFI